MHCTNSPYPEGDDALAFSIADVRRNVGSENGVQQLHAVLYSPCEKSESGSVP